MRSAADVGVDVGLDLCAVEMAVEMRHDERVVEGEAQEQRPFGVVERRLQREPEPKSVGYHASDISAGEELQALQKPEAVVYAHAIARAVRAPYLGQVRHENDVGL